MKSINISTVPGNFKKMSYYYKYEFTSPEGIYAIVQEELKSYFDTGAVDTSMFPTYTNKCLNKLGKSSYNITEEVLYIEDFEARLPDNFVAVREAWLCTSIDGFPVQNANSFYSQAASETTIQVSPIISGGEPCTNIECSDPNCDGNCMPEMIQAVYKTNNQFTLSYKKMYLLKPGNVSVKQHCSLDCANFGSSVVDSFDIRSNKFVTNFKEGTVYLVFYSDDYDNKGNQMVPKNYRIMEYIEKFLKFKVFETLCNQVNDETFNQLESKRDRAQRESDEAYILAETEIKKQTIYQKQNAIKHQLNKFNMYELPNRNYRFGRKRRN